jgi:hypothetical protein
MTKTQRDCEHTHGKDMSTWICSLLVVFIELHGGSIKYRLEETVLEFVSLARPCSMQCFNFRNSIGESGNMSRWECLLCFVSMLYAGSQSNYTSYKHRRAHTEEATEYTNTLLLVLREWEHLFFLHFKITIYANTKLIDKLPKAVA